MNCFSERKSRAENIRVPVQRNRFSSVDNFSRRSSGFLKARPSSEERKSTYSANKPGRWSGIPKNSFGAANDGKIKDTRPLTDKTYQKQKMTDLLNFLDMCNFNLFPLSLRDLMQPSKKKFEQMFEFLSSIIDPTFEVKKFEDDALKFLKSLSYPFIPTKSTLLYCAYNSFHHLVGILVFLLEVAKFTLNVQQDIFETNLISFKGQNAEDEKVLLRYFCECYARGEDNPEEDHKVFSAILQKRLPQNANDLQQEKSELVLNLEKLQQQIHDIEVIKKQTANLEVDIKKYEDVCEKMSERTERKTVSLNKLIDELSAKKLQATEQEAILNSKQHIYEAQGFDGRKQMEFYRNQKKDLLDTLDSKKEAVKDVQEKCWEAEMRYTKTVDKSGTVCEEFKKSYSGLREDADSIGKHLKSTKDSQLENISDELCRLFPEYSLQLSQNAIMQGKSLKENPLDAIKKSLDSISAVIKGAEASWGNKLHELQMRKVGLSVKLKFASAEEKKREQEAILQKQNELDSAKSFESKISGMLEQLESVRNETSTLEKELYEKHEELKEILALKVQKQKMLDDYLVEQKNAFEEMELNCKKLGEYAESCGGELLKTLENIEKRLP